MRPVRLLTSTEENDWVVGFLDHPWPEAGGGFEIADPDVPGVGTYDVSAAARAAGAANAPSYTMAGRRGPFCSIHTCVSART